MSSTSIQILGYSWLKGGKSGLTVMYIYTYIHMYSDQKNLVGSLLGDVEQQEEQTIKHIQHSSLNNQGFIWVLFPQL